MLLAQRIRDEVKGSLDLPVGELVRAGPPLFGDAEPGLVGLGQGGQRRVHPGQVRGPVIFQGEHHPGQQGTGRQLPVPHPGGQHLLDRRRHARGIDDVLEHVQRDAHR